MDFKYIKNTLVLLWFVILTSLITSCKLDEELSYIMYENNSEDTIIVFASPMLNTLYINSSSYYGCNEILPNAIISSPFTQEFVKDTLICYYVKNSLPYYFEEDKKQLDVLCKYELSVSNLKEINYIIPYPPTSVMQNMKIYPPYEDKL